MFSACTVLLDDQYPEYWPVLEPASGDCANISGSYVEIGQSSERESSFIPPMYSNPSLSRELLRTDLLGNKAIAVAQPNATTVVVTAVEATGVYAEGVSKSRTFNLENDDFWCDEGKIWFPRGGRMWAKSKIAFTTAADGSLVAEYHEADETGLTKIMYFLWPADARAK